MQDPLGTGVLPGYLQKSEDEVFRKLRQNAELDWVKLGNFMLFSFADAASIEHGYHRLGSVYEQTQRILFKALDNSLNALGQHAKHVLSLRNHLVLARCLMR